MEMDKIKTPTYKYIQLGSEIWLIIVTKELRIYIMDLHKVLLCYNVNYHYDTYDIVKYLDLTKE